jgi:hypothetical protein
LACCAKKNLAILNVKRTTETSLLKHQTGKRDRFHFDLLEQNEGKKTFFCKLCLNARAVKRQVELLKPKFINSTLHYVIISNYPEILASFASKLQRLFNKSFL